MSYPEGHKGSIEARRFQRYEIDTEINVAVFAQDKHGVMRGRALNISGSRHGWFIRKRVGHGHSSESQILCAGGKQSS